MAEWVRAPAYNLREQGVAGSILGQVKFLFLNQIFYLAPQCQGAHCPRRDLAKKILPKIFAASDDGWRRIRYIS